MDPYIGEIRIFAGTFAPRHYAFCDGAFLAPEQYPALFNLLRFNYGGQGVTSFRLPDLRGRAPMGMGAGTGLTPRNIGPLAPSGTTVSGTGAAAAGSGEGYPYRGLPPGLGLNFIIALAGIYPTR